MVHNASLNSHNQGLASGARSSPIIRVHREFTVYELVPFGGRQAGMDEGGGGLLNGSCVRFARCSAGGTPHFLSIHPYLCTPAPTNAVYSRCIRRTLIGPFSMRWSLYTRTDGSYMYVPSYWTLREREIEKEGG